MLKGSLTATCSDENCELHTTTATLTIAAPLHTIYGDGEDASAVIIDDNGIQGDATVVYYKATKNGDVYTKGEELASVPSNAGDYVAEITLGTGDYSETASVNYTIAKADPTAAAPSATATYGQTLADITLTNPTGNTEGTWAWVDTGTTSVGSVGNHTFKANFTPSDTANYNSVSNKDVTVTVSKAANPATVASTATVTKGGNTVDLKDNVTLNGATGAVSYAISGETSGCSLKGSVLTSGENSGSVTVNVTVAADNNYEALATKTITVTITEKNVQTISAYDFDDQKINPGPTHVQGTEVCKEVRCQCCRHLSGSESMGSSKLADVPSGQRSDG